jgi:hypothetical protein
MKKIALLAQWAGDFKTAQVEYDRLFTESLDEGDPVEARLLVTPGAVCELVSSIEQGEAHPVELLKEIIARKEAQIRSRFAGKDQSKAEGEDLIREMLEAGRQVAQAVRDLMPDSNAGENRAEQHKRDTPLQLVSNERFVSVHSHPRGLETRSYYRADITVDLEATKERLIQQAGATFTGQTDRMLEVEVLGELLEIFIDGRVRWVSEPQDPNRVGKLVLEIGSKLVLRA